MRKPQQLAESLNHRLNAYVLAASAAGVGALALAQPAQAKIIYTKIHHVFKPNSLYRLDLNHDRVTDFYLSLLPSLETYGYGHNLLVRPLRSFAELNEEMGISTQNRREVYASALRQGMRIGREESFHSKWEGMAQAFATSRSGKISSGGNWLNVTDRYLGLKFVFDGHPHYGWARLSVKVSGINITAVLTGYAYETIPNKSIMAGREHGK